MSTPAVTNNRNYLDSEIRRTDFEIKQLQRAISDHKQQIEIITRNIKQNQQLLEQQKNHAQEYIKKGQQLKELEVYKAKMEESLRSLLNQNSETKIDEKYQETLQILKLAHRDVNNDEYIISLLKVPGATTAQVSAELTLHPKPPVTFKSVASAIGRNASAIGRNISSVTNALTHFAIGDTVEQTYSGITEQISKLNPLHSNAITNNNNNNTIQDFKVFYYMEIGRLPEIEHYYSEHIFGELAERNRNVKIKRIYSPLDIPSKTEQCILIYFIQVDPRNTLGDIETKITEFNFKAKSTIKTVFIACRIDDLRPPFDSKTPMFTLEPEIITESAVKKRGLIYSIIKFLYRSNTYAQQHYTTGEQEYSNNLIKYCANYINDIILGIR